MQTVFKPHSALLIIDMLNDFVLDGAPLQVPKAKEIIPNIIKIAEQARTQQVPVIYTCDAHNPVDRQFSDWPKHAVWGTEGAEIIEELTPNETDWIVTKRRYSGFFQTDLDLLLRELKVVHLFLSGIVTDICIYHTAADAYFLGFRITILKDCVAALTEEQQNWAFSQMKRLFGAEIV